MKSEKYKDLSCGGGITGYKFLDSGIILQFKHQDLYFYDDVKPGKDHVDQMKLLTRKAKS